MKNFFKTALTLLLIGVIPVSCDFFCRHSCCGEDDRPKKMKIKEMGFRDASLSYNATIDSIQYYSPNEIAKELYIKERDYVFKRKRRGVFSLISSAYACDPVPPVAIQKISKIDIISRKDLFYNEKFKEIKAGKEINAMFSIGEYSSFTSLEEFYQRNREIYEGTAYKLAVNTAPADSAVLEFDVKVILSDSSVHLFEHQTMKLKKE